MNIKFKSDTTDGQLLAEIQKMEDFEWALKFITIIFNDGSYFTDDKQFKLIMPIQNYGIASKVLLRHYLWDTKKLNKLQKTYALQLLNNPYEIL